MIYTFGIVIALGAAARSTWSPCGLSMLSQITPVAEAGRRHNFARTATWFIAGAVLGGVTLGGAIAAGATAFGAAGFGTNTAVALIAGCTLAAAAVDARVIGAGPPFVRRQVNEEWLSKYRPWVYGGGFGWQIGVGVTTYVMTAAVPLMIVIGVLSASPWAALSIGCIFGAVRGAAVLLGARLRDQPALYAFHRRFDAWGEPVRKLVLAIELTVAVVAAWIVAPIVISIFVTLAAGTLLVRMPQATSRAPRSWRLGFGR